MKKRLLSSKENADRAIAGILEEKEISPLTIYRHLKSYVMYKFFFTEDEMTTDDFTELTEQSIAKASKMDPAMLKELIRAQKCTSASSVAIKKVLFYMDIQKQLGIRFDPEKTGAVETLGDIADLIYEKIKVQMI